MRKYFYSLGARTHTYSTDYLPTQNLQSEILSEISKRRSDWLKSLTEPTLIAGEF